MRPIVVVDLGYGDGGKGALVDRICAREPVSAVVRFNGGCQAAHNVVDDRGRHHTFAQFGSGTLQGVKTYLSSYVCVEPLSLLNEAQALKNLGVPDPLSLVTIAHDAKLTTPYHWLVNQWRERGRGDHRHGSTGRGVGETENYSQSHNWGEVPLVEDLHPRSFGILVEKLRALREWAREETGDAVPLPSAEQLAKRYEYTCADLRIASDEELLRLWAEDGRLVFEGAQGVLLDEHVGFHPYTTWSTVTPDNARTLLAKVHIEPPTVLGVVRAYSTRHGAGPFVPEDPALNLPEPHNGDGEFQGSWRVGHLDVPALRHAVAMAQPDQLYVTHVDTAHREPNLQVCMAYKGGAEDRLDYHNPRTDLNTRAAASDLLKDAQPVLVDRPKYSWGASVGDLLELEVVGIGYGPRTADGAWSAT